MKEKEEECKLCDHEVERSDYKTFIAAPFGNWIKPAGCIAVNGTYTLEPRGNVLWSIAKSLRYDFRRQGWTNRLQLPNPGVVVGLERIVSRNEVLSIAEVNRGDFKELVQIIPTDQSIELNLSCPNLGTALPWDSTEVFIKYKGMNWEREWCIAKLSPLTTPEQLEFLIDDLGFTQLHFSNTLPWRGAGGLSGHVLRPYTLELIKLVRENWGDSVTIIAGGGIKNWQNIYQYLSKGADHVSLGSVCFNPLALRKILRKGK